MGRETRCKVLSGVLEAETFYYSRATLGGAGVGGVNIYPAKEDMGQRKAEGGGGTRGPEASSAHESLPEEPTSERISSSSSAMSSFAAK